MGPDPASKSPIQIHPNPASKSLALCHVDDVAQEFEEIIHLAFSSSGDG